MLMLGKFLIFCLHFFFFFMMGESCEILTVVFNLLVILFIIIKSLFKLYLRKNASDASCVSEDVHGEEEGLR